MKKLKNRAMQIPNGLTFLQPETGWRPRTGSSFEGIVQALVSHRLGNPALKAKGLTTDPRSVANEVETFNAKLCEKMGWTDYIIEASSGGTPPPSFFQRKASGLPLQTANPSALNAVAGKVKAIWSGVRTLNDWLDSNDPPVIASLSHSRAAICVACPKNTEGDFTEWFTKPAAAAIKKQLERLHERKLTTPQDAQLNVCNICLCPLKLKVHTPMSYIKENTGDEVLADLRKVPNCWVVREMNV